MQRGLGRTVGPRQAATLTALCVRVVVVQRRQAASDEHARVRQQEGNDAEASAGCDARQWRARSVCEVRGSRAWAGLARTC